MKKTILAAAVAAAMLMTSSPLLAEGGLGQCCNASGTFGGGSGSGSVQTNRVDRNDSPNEVRDAVRKMSDRQRNLLARAFKSGNADKNVKIVVLGDPKSSIVDASNAAKGIWKSASGREKSKAADTTRTSKFTGGGNGAPGTMTDRELKYAVGEAELNGDIDAMRMYRNEQARRERLGISDNPNASGGSRNETGNAYDRVDPAMDANEMSRRNQN